MNETRAVFTNEALGERVIIEPDEFTDDPLGCEEWCRFLTIENHRHSWGHKQLSKEALKEATDKARAAGKTVVTVYAYVHSGVAFSLGNSYPFNCPWDAGPCGVIIVDKPDHVGDVDQALKAMLQEYNDWCMGNCWGFVRQKKETCGHCEHDEWEDTDSCGGFIGCYDDKHILHAADIMDIEDAGEGIFVGTMKEGWEETDSPY